MTCPPFSHGRKKKENSFCFFFFYSLVCVFDVFVCRGEEVARRSRADSFFFGCRVRHSRLRHHMCWRRSRRREEKVERGQPTHIVPIVLRKEREREKCRLHKTGKTTLPFFFFSLQAVKIKRPKNMTTETDTSSEKICFYYPPLFIVIPFGLFICIFCNFFFF